ncbi:hypothetical protein EDC01DRAFT_629744 [Geopyxis carbonaria]|nr:hypothetical protein EDC01DRAFT_629744 [Geopyxis carbonaria]
MDNDKSRRWGNATVQVVLTLDPINGVGFKNQFTKRAAREMPKEDQISTLVDGTVEAGVPGHTVLVQFCLPDYIRIWNRIASVLLVMLAVFFWGVLGSEDGRSEIFKGVIINLIADA